MIGRALKGEERRRLRDHLAFGRAFFEREYEGRPIVPFDRQAVIAAIRAYKPELLGDAIISDAFVRECQRRVAYCRRAIDAAEAAPEQAQAKAQERHERLTDAERSEERRAIGQVHRPIAGLGKP